MIIKNLFTSPLKKALPLLFIVAACSANAQDTTRGVMKVVRRSTTPGVSVKQKDTTKLVYDEKGNLLHFYQYSKLVNTGQYSLRYKGDPALPETTGYLVKVDPAATRRMYDMMKPVLAIKSPLLREGSKLDVAPFLGEFSKEDFAGKKAIVLLFWESSCIQCVENFVSVNDYFKTIANPNDILIIAISHDDERTINTKSMQKPLVLAHFAGGTTGQHIDEYYQLRSMPSYVVADKDLVIRFAITGAAPAAMPVFKDTISQLLAN